MQRFRHYWPHSCRDSGITGPIHADKRNNHIHSRLIRQQLLQSEPFTMDKSGEMQDMHASGSQVILDPGSRIWKMTVSCALANGILVTLRTCGSLSTSKPKPALPAPVTQPLRNLKVPDTVAVHFT
ncbi:hypothetical protein AB1N83_012238 [Pleurotus pulmonarius]